MFEILKYNRQKIKNTCLFIPCSKEYKISGFSYLNQSRNTKHTTIDILILNTHVSGSFSFQVKYILTENQVRRFF